MIRHLFLRLEALKVIDEQMSLFALRSVRLINKTDFAAEEKLFRDKNEADESAPLIEPSTTESESSYVSRSSLSPYHNTSQSTFSTLREARNKNPLSTLQEPPPWKDSKICKGCNVKFGIGVNKHHCRNCGGN